MKHIKNKLLIIYTIMLLTPCKVFAGRGCCSHHGGVSGCSSTGRQICADGSLSPSCTCTPAYIYGCTDVNAYNYNSRANKNDGSCKYYTYGCTDKEAYNYDAEANKDDGSCKYYTYGCTDREAYNYNAGANKDDGSCKYYIYGCTDINAYNYNSNADKDDGSCRYHDIEENDKENDSNDEKNEDDGVLPAIIISGLLAGGAYSFRKRKK